VARSILRVVIRSDGYHLQIQREGVWQPLLSFDDVGAALRAFWQEIAPTADLEAIMHSGDIVPISEGEDDEPTAVIDPP
jgi:hypothetical protein